MYWNFLFTLLLLKLTTGLLADSMTLENTHKIKVLHLTFHKGCQKEIEGVAKELSLDLETWFIPDLPLQFFDGASKGNCLYNMGHKRAENVWQLHKEFFDRFDVIITSDTAPLSRIFLQGGWTKPLIIWICNRFDYTSIDALDCDFPDKEYYQLFDEATKKSNVRIVAYTLFEHLYARTKGIDTGTLTITPTGIISLEEKSFIPAYVDKPSTLFLPPYHNEQNFKDALSLLLPIYCGRYNGPTDLVDFKAIIHFPYAWSNLALFENISLGTPYFIPSKTLFKELYHSSDYFFTNSVLLLKEDLFEVSEWYAPDRAEIFVYFDSWEDLKVKLESLDFIAQHDKIKSYASNHKIEMLNRWQLLFNSLTPCAK